MNNRAALLDALLADPARAADVPNGEAVALLTALATLQVALLQAVCRPAEAPQRDPERPNEDRMLNVQETATLLGVSPRWLYRNSKRLPFARPISPKILRFSRNGAVKWLAVRRT